MDDYNVYGLRYYWICQEVSGSLLAKTLEVLFKGGKPVEKNLEKKIMLSNFNVGERYTLGQIKDGSKNLQDLDVCLLFRLIQRTCGLAPPHHRVWRCNCKIDKSIILEHCLFQIRELRNEAVHEFRFLLRSMSSKEFEDRKKEIGTLFKKIIQQVCSRKKLSADEMYRWNTQVMDSFQEISLGVTIGQQTQVTQPSQRIRTLLRDDSVDGISFVDTKEAFEHTESVEPSEELDYDVVNESGELDDDAYIAVWNASLPSKSAMELISDCICDLGSSWGIEVIGISFVCYYLYRKAGKLTF